jgi:hypothetical protein
MGASGLHRRIGARSRHHRSICAHKLQCIIGKSAQQARQFSDVPCIPFCQQRSHAFLARAIQSPRHRFPLFGERGARDPRIGCAGVSSDKSQARKLRDLPAHGRIVASAQPSELTDRQRSSASDTHQQREQCPVEVDPGERNQRRVGLRTPLRSSNASYNCRRSRFIVCSTRDNMCIIHIITAISRFAPEAGEYEGSSRDGSGSGACVR